MKKFILFVLFSTLIGSIYGQLIINHNHRNITTLTQSEIELAKSKLHIAYGHTSHGSQVTSGMTGLVAFANGGGKGLSLPTNIFAWNNGGTNGALDLHDYAMGGDVGYYPQWVNNTTSYLGPVDPQTGRGTNNPDVNVIMWSWCGQASSRTEQTMIDTYLNPMTVLETTYPNVKFVYMTGHLEGTGLTGNLHLRNEQIRNYCSANNKILFDFADIECYDPDGNYYGDKHPTDGCTYDASGNGSTSATGDPDIPIEGSGDRNWAIDWCASHTQNTDWYSCGAAHTNALNANQKAYAAWHMFVEIAKILASEEIPNDLTVSDTIVANGNSVCFDATNSITVEDNSSIVTFENGSTVNLIAGNSITFLPGFHAQLGSYTHAFITTDESYCFDLPTSILAAPTAYKSSEDIFDWNESNDLKNKSTLKVCPNPNKGSFNIRLEHFEAPVQIMIFNAAGALVYKTNTDENELSINLINEKQGIYFLRAFNDKEQFSLKIRIE